MAFVNLWRGILFCDTIPVEGEAISPLRYVQLPSMLPNSMFRGDGRLARDIAVINNELRFVELRVRLKESKVSEGDVFEDGWMAIIWTRPISNGVWCKKFKVDTRDMDLNNNPYVKKLPKVFNDEDMILPPFKRIEICQPTLGLHEDGSCIVYFMIKKRRQDRDAWVLAVDMKLNTIVGITSFSAARNTFIRFAYHDSRISKYLPKIALGNCLQIHMGPETAKGGVAAIL
ncbi:hypothetical protein PR202_gb20878 [Eleusine coracana subsp. coracana]|uniref:DUF1618 domain-containing protein n=1 Tax=Eleusine coracana subsp. coracana TaxID=191504 RepID=A0AAV5FBK4_ELECO|nr:hypothetical protein PR202_gb20878 [Eleusine coracana subsp. coracana]